MAKTAIIVGAGPAGLTAALEMLRRTDIRPIVLEKSACMGGISRTVNYKGNRIDIGGHRFFSKSDRVMNWWLEHLPLEAAAAPSARITYQGKTRSVAAGAGVARVSDPCTPGSETRATHSLGGGACALAEAPNDDRVMLLRRRRSRIYFLRQFFDYPIQLSADTIRKLGLTRTARIGLSYARAVLRPIRKVITLEDFLINRFGRELYRTFFETYTEKVWGVPCRRISAEWGEQRIKGLSVLKTITHVLKRALRRRSDVAQKSTETSLIEQFLYPKFGPGQMWEEVARKVVAAGGTIVTDFSVSSIETADGRVVAVSGADASGRTRRFAGDLFISTMPVKELVGSMNGEVPAAMREISDGLVYRDFITVGLLLTGLKVRDPNSRLISDNWIYIQEPEVRAGRLQIFNNWSPHMVADPNTVWIGVEYFCDEGDELWTRPDAAMTGLAIRELAAIDIIEPPEVLDSVVIRMPKTYPAYFGTYPRFHQLRAWLDGIDNLFLIGRNGMHKYNNQDHSMLTAMITVDNILAGRTDKSNLWAVNTEQEYHETKD